MKQLGPLLSSLADGTTTLAWCWRITRADGEVLGLTARNRAMWWPVAVLVSAGIILGSAAWRART